MAPAAHDVLVHYAPLLHDNPAAPDVAAQVVSTLRHAPEGIADGRARRPGRGQGRPDRRARPASTSSPAGKGDHFRDGSIHYSKPKLPGYWQPTPPRTDMLEAWLGSLDTVVLHRLVRVDGPDGLTSYDYARDYNEVKRYGDSISPRRSPEETQTAHFFNSNSATTVGNALIRYLKAHPMGLRATARRVRGDARRDDRRRDQVLAAQARRGVLASPGGHRRRRARRQPGHHPAARVDLPDPAGAAVLRLRQRARLPHRPGDGDDPADVRRGDPAPPGLDQPERDSSRSGTTTTSATSRPTPSTRGSGAGCTSATRWRTPTTSAARPPGG